jgi:hypothetical protein
MIRLQNYPRQEELKRRVWDFAERTATKDTAVKATTHVG